MKKNLQIEGLRGCCVLIVVLYHVFCRYAQEYLDGNIPWMQHWGSFGVTVFLMISAFFLIPQKTSGGGYREFVHKIKRLWPSYAVCLTITFIINLLLPLPGRGGDLRDYLWNLSFLNGYIGTGYIDRAHWYMTTLLSLIVVMCAIKAFGLAHKAESYLVWSCAVLVLKAVNLDKLANILGGTYVFIACFGFTLAALVHSGTFIKKDIYHLKWYTVIALELAFTYRYYGLVRIVELMIALVLIIGCLSGRLHIMEWKPLQFFGAISYTLYLLHQNVAYTIEYYLMQFVGEYYYWMGTVALGLIIGTAILIEQLFKKTSN